MHNKGHAGLFCPHELWDQRVNLPDFGVPRNVNANNTLIAVFQGKSTVAFAISKEEFLLRLKMTLA